MCPVAAESKNSNPIPKKKINKKINLKLDESVDQEKIINNQEATQNIQEGANDDIDRIENNNDFNDSDEEDKSLANIKLGPKGIYTEDSIRVYLQEIGRIRLLRPDEEIELARKIADLL